MFNDPRGEQVATPALRRAGDEMTTCERISLSSPPAAPLPPPPPTPTPPHPTTTRRHVGFNAERQTGGAAYLELC